MTPDFEKKAELIMLSLYPHTPVDEWHDDEHENCSKISTALKEAFNAGLERGAETAEVSVARFGRILTPYDLAEAIRNERL